LARVMRRPPPTIRARDFAQVGLALGAQVFELLGDLDRQVARAIGPQR
jgi:hypothetical protein